MLHVFWGIALVCGAVSAALHADRRAAVELGAPWPLNPLRAMVFNVMAWASLAISGALALYFAGLLWPGLLAALLWFGLRAARRDGRLAPLRPLAEPLAGAALAATFGVWIAM